MANSVFWEIWRHLTARSNVRQNTTDDVTPSNGEKSAQRGSSRRQLELDWLTQHKDLSHHYGGQWIVLEKNELIASDKDYIKARNAATQQGIERPFIIFVPLEEDEAFMGV